MCNGSKLIFQDLTLFPENIDSTMIYLQLDLGKKREVQQKFIQYTQDILECDPRLDECIDWRNKDQILSWLDSL